MTTRQTGFEFKHVEVPQSPTIVDLVTNKYGMFFWEVAGTQTVVANVCKRNNNWIIMTIVLVLALSACNDGDDRPTEGLVTAAELYSAYHTDENAADERFQGKVMQIKGAVGGGLFGNHVDITMDGRVTINLVGESGREGSFIVVRCYSPLPKTREKAVAQARRLYESLDPGQHVTVKGRVDGTDLGWVSVEDCSLLK